VVLVLLAVATPAHAVSFYPVDSVSASTAATDFAEASNLIHGPGVGFDAAEPHTRLGGGWDHVWLTEANCGYPAEYLACLPAPVLVFDLGIEVALSEISVWGYDVTIANGVSLFGLRFATDAEGPGAFGTSIAFAPSYILVNDDTNRQSHEFGQTVSARYVEFTALDNFFVAPGDGSTGGLPGGDRVGLGEVGFAVPEPGAGLLLLTGLLGLASYRRAWP
jgi:hypothetical protein